MKSAIPIALLAISGAWAQAPGGRRGPTPAVAVNLADQAPRAVRTEDKCTLEGNVVSAATGQPLKKTRLTLRPAGQAGGTPYGATTDAAGHFVIEGVDPGRYMFSASHNGYVNQPYSPDGNLTRASTLTLTDGQKLKEIVFKMMPQGVISGRILDEDGDPMVNVQVECMVYGYSRGRRQLMGSDDTSTNDLGEFRLYGLKPGKYVLSATYRSRDMFAPPPGRTPETAQGAQAAEERYTTTYYPNSTSSENATAIDVTAGAQITGINMTLARIRTVSVQGHLNLGPSERPRRNISILLAPRDGAGGFSMARAAGRNIDAQGNFLMRGVASGSYLLRADYVEDGKRFTSRMPLEVGTTNISGLELNFVPPLDIQGHILVADNGDLKGARVQVSLQPRAAGPAMRGGNAPVKDDLTFQVGNLSPDPYDVNLRGLPDGYYLKAVRLGQQDVTEAGVDLSQGAVGAELNLVVSPNGGQIDGVVQNSKGDPAAGALVTLIPEPGHQFLSTQFKTATADQNGRFSIKSLRPGEYKLYAWEDIEPGAYQDPDFVKPHESSGQSVSVKESGHENLTVKVIPAEDVSPNSGR